MTNLYRRLGALTVLGLTAGVSMLAGSVLLGSASADEPDKTPTAVTAPATQVSRLPTPAAWVSGEATGKHPLA